MSKTKSTVGSAVTSAKSTMIRFTAYTVGVFTLTLSLPLVIEHGDIVIFKEDGPIEWFQFGVLVTASAVFLLGGFALVNFRQVLYLMAFVSVFAAIRELDAFLERAIPWIGWKIAFIAILYAVGSAYTKRTLVKRQLPPFLATRAFAILWAGFLVAVPFGQLIGHGAFLQVVMGDDYNRDYKRVIEETLETMGYILVLIGSFESILQLRTVVPDRHVDNSGQ
jgi:hypothetical protein